MLKHEGKCKKRQCQKCERIFPSANALLKHEREHKDKPQYPTDKVNIFFTFYIYKYIINSNIIFINVK